MENQIAKFANEMYTYLSFEIGALTRDALEELAADFKVDFDKHINREDLVSSVLQKLEQQGEPCVRFEYDPAYVGGEYSGVGSFVYVPYSYFFPQVQIEGNDNVYLAFRKFTNMDSMHVVNVEWDEVFTWEGNSFVGVKLVEGFYGNSKQQEHIVQVTFESRWENGVVATSAKLDIESGRVFDIEQSDSVDHCDALIGEYVLVGSHEIPVELGPDDDYRIALLTLVKIKAELLVEESKLESNEEKTSSNAAKLFWRELLDAVECLTAVADQYGSRTLADLMYLQNAIHSGGFIDHYPNESRVLEIVELLPSADCWKQRIKMEYLAEPAVIA